MSRIFLIADTHFGHHGVCRFLDDAGEKIRPWVDIETMDSELIRRWNDTVRPKDVVIHLGDVALNRRGLKPLSLLNGQKFLVRGNHDIFRDEEYLEYFQNIYSCHVVDNLLLTHIPVHPNSLRKYTANVHGHLHQRSVMKIVAYDQTSTEKDPRYCCVSVEQTNFAPQILEDVKKRIAAAQNPVS